MSDEPRTKDATRVLPDELMTPEEAARAVAFAGDGTPAAEETRVAAELAVNDETVTFVEEIITIPDTELTEEQIELIESLEKESKTRNFSGIMAKLFYSLCIVVSLYHLYTAYAGPVLFGIPLGQMRHRAIHVGMMLVLAFIMYPAHKKASYKKMAWYDWLLAALAVAMPVYTCLEYDPGLIMRAGRPNTMDVVIATLLIVLVLEAARRVAGWILTVLSVVFIAYGLFGHLLPGMFYHRQYNWAQVTSGLYPTLEGIFGTSVDVATSYIFLFILFGAVMAKTGMGQFFNDIALALAGRTKGGPAKVAVIASGFLGSINGSAIANVVTTGSFTIPLMKKTGYSKEFAGAVEAAASVGGQLLPPVMGAAAFIMAEMLSMKYSTVALAAALPAVLYYIGIMVQVHLRAAKHGLVGLPKDKLPRARDVMKQQGYLLLPIIFLLYMLIGTNVTVIFAAFWTIVVTFAIALIASFVKGMGKENNTVGSILKKNGKDALDALADGAKQTVSVAIACACVGIVVGIVTKTGFGVSMGQAIVKLGQTSLMLTLVLTMVTCMILGMGLPSIPAFVITATIAAKPLGTDLGVPMLAAYMFAFYFAMFANLTPPVALAAFAAAGISGGNPMKTGWQSVKLAIAGFIVPYMFIYAPELLLIDVPATLAATEAAGRSVTVLAFTLDSVRIMLTSLMGVVLIGISVEGHLFTKVNPLLRIIGGIAALFLIYPEIITDLIGAVVFVATYVLQYTLYRRHKAKPQPPPLAAA